MNICDLIYKKRNNGKLTEEEIRFAVSSYVSGGVADYQMSAMLMAMFIRGIDKAETFALTKAMVESGKVCDLSRIEGPKIDKHSTGGVGDGTSLVIAPLAACAGIIVPMMAGRSLGHTGGTLDKLESIRGFRVNISETQYKKQLQKLGVAMISQTQNLAPADKKMYALRDVTATVDSIPLIAASIMSKKIAEGADGLVLDVKTGTGAFIQKKEDCEELAKLMVEIGENCSKKMDALITDMSQPLGNCVGNALEVKQAINVLKSTGPKDFTDLVLTLTSRMLILGKVEKDIQRAKARLKKLLNSGAALEKFREIIIAQKGDPRVIDKPDKYLPKAAGKCPLAAKNAGFINSINTREIGLASVLIGAGRTKKEDKIDTGAGFVIYKKLGDYVKKNEPLARMHYNHSKNVEEAKNRFINAYSITENKGSYPPLIYSEIS
jgi:pyrimidine-nucleoside phosphorylase